MTREAWAYLNRVVEGPNAALLETLAAGRDAQEVAHGIRTRASWLSPELERATQARHSWDRPGEDLEAAAQAGFSLLTPESPEWPKELMEEAFVHGANTAAKSTGERLPHDGVAPHALWVRGNTNLPQLFARAVGIVGTRAASAYGHHATGDLCKGLARHQYTIVSGGALGIDTVAHRTALDNNAATVAIAACGPGMVYPMRNEQLFDEICGSGGAIITEYPPGMPPDRHRFLTRNRLVAALTQGSIVVEAAFRSGALNTMAWARRYNRVSMAVPGPILGPGSLGANLLIRDEKARMVLSADEAHELMGRIGDVDPDAQLEFDYPADNIQSLSRNELRIFDALPRPGCGELQAEDVAKISGFTIGLSVHILMDLQRRGLVAREASQWRRTE